MTLITQEHHDALQALYPVIAKAARSVAYQWPGVVEADDAQQMIAQQLWERPASLLKVASMDDKAQYRAVVGIGHQLASQERTDYDHYKGSYKYSVGDVKSLLSRGVLVSEVEGFTDAVLDLMEGLESMVEKKPQYVDSITSRYADGEVPARGAAQKRLVDALTALTNAMNASGRRRFNERDDGPGTRTILTNAQAQAVSSHQYDGDHDYAANLAHSSGGYR
ncbi:RNA polymerase sigma factor [Mycobacterium phage BogosyJay]|nr:RNA polymerase sigma factor [Mycobacterium phage Maminiaina]QFG14962.1 RNA polymerase sigma factor [Mycobacterium phage BogosyJay]